MGSRELVVSSGSIRRDGGFDLPAPDRGAAEGAESGQENVADQTRQCRENQGGRTGKFF